jgi:hypothetical protein
MSRDPPAGVNEASDDRDHENGRSQQDLKSALRDK